MIELREDGLYHIVSDQAVTMVVDEIRANLLEVLPESIDHLT